MTVDATSLKHSKYHVHKQIIGKGKPPICQNKFPAKISGHTVYDWGEPE